MEQALQILAKARLELEKKIADADKKYNESLDAIAGQQTELDRLRTQLQEITTAETTLKTAEARL
jgi:uncharacterized coiled-coil protein SlyX